MWCGQCKQDVPAVVRGDERRACPRCYSRLAVASADDGFEGLAAPDDSGISLDALDRPAVACSRAPSIEDSAEQLRRIARKLRTNVRTHAGHAVAEPPAAPVAAWPSFAVDLSAPSAEPPLAPPPMRRGRGEASLAWSIELLLAVGVMTLLTGVSCLTWAATDGPPLAGRWGMPAAIAGQGLLLLGLARIVARLLRNSGRMANQLDGVDRQLHDMRRTSSAGASCRVS